MKMPFILVVFVFLAAIAFAQEPKRKYYYTDLPVSPFYGSKLLLHAPFNKQVNSIKSFTFNRAISYAGVCLSYPASMNAWSDNEPYIYYAQVLPQQIAVNDSVHAGLSGFQVGVGYYGLNVIPFRRRFQLYIMLGFNTGRLKLSGSNDFLQKNGFFSPKITVMPDLWITKWLRLSLLLDYEYDVSKKGWKTVKKHDAQAAIGNLSQTGFSGGIKLSVRIRHKELNSKEKGEKKKEIRKR